MSFTGWRLVQIMTLQGRPANSLGFSVYRGRDFGGGFVGQSYNVENTAENIIKARDAQ